MLKHLHWFRRYRQAQKIAKSYFEPGEQVQFSQRKGRQIMKRIQRKGKA